MQHAGHSTNWKQDPGVAQILRGRIARSEQKRRGKTLASGWIGGVIIRPVSLQRVICDAQRAVRIEKATSYPSCIDSSQSVMPIVFARSSQVLGQDRRQ
jgi:hypothetical protein